MLIYLLECKFYFCEVMGRLINDIPLKVLHENKLLSSRAFTVCKEINREPTFNEIINFYNEHHTFIKVRNCGVNTNIELEDICENAIEIYTKLEQNLTHH